MCFEKYAQKLLSEVSKEEKVYSDAQRLLSLLAYFLKLLLKMYLLIQFYVNLLGEVHFWGIKQSYLSRNMI